MAASEHLHPKQLGSFAKEYAKNLDFNPLNPEEAEGRCEDCSQGFLEWGKQQGLSGAVRYYHTHSGHHAVARVDTSEGPHVVDYTHNQFVMFDQGVRIDPPTRRGWPKSMMEKSPLVMPLERYENERMRADGEEDADKFFGRKKK